MALSAEIALSLQELVLGLNITIPLLWPNLRKVRPRYRLFGNTTPTIDVCVTCCGEPTDIILNTVTAVAAQDYPAQNLRVMVLDDGRNGTLRKAVEAMGKSSAARRGPEILYRSRAMNAGEKSYYKSGNLQFGITELIKLGQSEFFANLDCDMIAEPDWLRRMIPQLIIAPSTALVNPPQVSGVL
jgi:cellulose synthase/poly-beta-1,6-N-acetylglucosamine synthase-like glycosyltransferase